ncbi:MAG: hypothetical protein IPJ25_07635 [Rhodocyclaceae bacterium]|nr:hypothetical protein [Rhodocyclaceae bacterium]
MKRIFISSVQKEFAQERGALRDNLRTGIGDMINRCTAHGLQVPVFKQTDGFITTSWRKPELVLSHVTPAIEEATTEGKEQVTNQVTEQVTKQVTEEVTEEVTTEVTEEVRVALGLQDAEHFHKTYLLPDVQAGFIAMTLPDKPQSSKQIYRLTPKGRRLIKSQP